MRKHLAKRLRGQQKLKGNLLKRYLVVNHNYRVATRFFSYRVIEEELRVMTRRPQNLYRLLGRTEAKRTELRKAFKRNA